MKIYCHGARAHGTQIDRIEKGFEEAGHTVVLLPEEADIIYSNDSSPGRDSIIESKKSGILKNKTIIFNVLDIPEWNFPNFNLEQMKQELSHADVVTCISKFVQVQLFKYFGITSYIVHNPIKDVSPEKRSAGIKNFKHKVAMVGRLQDPSKRARLAVESLILAGYKESDVAIVGSQPIGWGNYLGIINNQELNDLYNSVDYVVMTSLGEGLGLPALEGCVAGAIPVVCHDLTTFNEFYPQLLGNYPNPHCIAMFLKTANTPDNFNIVKQVGCIIREKLSGKSVARNIINAYHENISRNS